ncbi:MAG: type II toxin-antitoxin system RelE/ParE family toxin [Flavobacteriaceae bacterium]|nr:type II toxin-antitoxin system RelE/ParE family toxin [Flavobacteriaceae bacterium]
MISTKITDNFLDSLFNEFEFLVENPHSFQVKYKNTRVRCLKQFPFGVHYLIQENSIEILAIIHTSKNPKTWLKSK